MKRLTRRSAIASALALSACSQGAKSQPALTAPPPLRTLTPFPVGCCVQERWLHQPEYIDLLAEQFSQLTAEWEMKMEYILREDGGFQFDRPDSIASFAKARDMALHGHSLVWFANEPDAFKRLDGSGKPFADAYRNYILAVAGRYKGQARSWDVVNEPITDDGEHLRESLWSRNLGSDDHIALALEHAREADPHAVLFLNDYHLELKPNKRATFMRLIERLLKRGAPLGGIGTQTHIDYDLPTGAVDAALKDLASFGLPIHLSELDISLGDHYVPALPGDRVKRQIAKYTEVAEAFMALPARQRFAFTVWGLRDSDTWLRGDSGQRPKDQPLLFDEAGKAKATCRALADVFARRR
jgi:endo-1,4-beta-xylanase